MKRSSVFFLLFSFFTFSQLFAQESEVPASKAVMKVNGTGQMRVSPDLALVNMTVRAKDMDFNKAVKKLNEKSTDLNKKLLNAGFSKEEIKTSQLNVQENGHWRDGNYIDSGYVASQYIELKFKRDQKRMARLMEAFSKEKGAEALFHFGFTLSDEAKQKANEELIKKAVQDARSKATVIAGASGVQLGNIRNIIYGQPEYRPVPMYKTEEMAMSARGASDQSMPDIEIQEIEMQDTITIFWEML